MAYLKFYRYRLVNIVVLLSSVLLISFNGIAQYQNIGKKFRILTYGLQDVVRQNASDIIQSKWSIEFYAVAGCIVSQELQDSVEFENKQVFKLIEAKYGKNWKAKFFDEIEQEYEIEVRIDSLVKSQEYIKDKDIVNLFPEAPFPMYPLDKIGNYIVTVSTYTKDWKEQKLYKLKANYKNNMVEIITDFSLNK